MTLRRERELSPSRPTCVTSRERDMVVVRPMRIEAEESNSLSQSSEDDDCLLCDAHGAHFSSRRRPSAVPSLDVERAAELAAAEMRSDDDSAGSCDEATSSCQSAGHRGWNIAEGPEEEGEMKAGRRDGDAQQGWHILQGPAAPSTKRTRSTALPAATSKGRRYRPCAYGNTRPRPHSPNSRSFAASLAMTFVLNAGACLSRWQHRRESKR